MNPVDAKHPVQNRANQRRQDDQADPANRGPSVALVEHGVSGGQHLSDENRKAGQMWPKIV